MKQQILQMTGLNEDQFYKKYPTEAAFFRDYPQVKQMFKGGSAPSRSGYGVMLPYAQDGFQVQDPPRSLPDQKDYPDYESWTQAWDEWMSSKQQQADTAQIMPQGMTAQNTTAPVAPAASGFKLKDYKGPSIVDFLTTQGKAADFKSRKNLAKTLGIADYTGRPDQNTLMIELLRENPSVLNNYTGYTAPVGNTVKKAATVQNRKATPTTQQLAGAKNKQSGVSQSQPNFKQLSEIIIQPDVKRLNEIVIDPADYVKGRDIVTGKKRFDTPDPSGVSGKVFLNPTTMKYEAIPDPNGMMTAESMYRMKLADKLNSTMPGKGASLRQGYGDGGNVYPDGYSGTYSAGQYYGEGGAFMPQYADNAFGLPQFELGAPTYADGGMSPEQAMMMQQMSGQQEAPQQQFDQEQLMNDVSQMIQQGMQPQQIIQELISMGVPQIMATELINLVAQQMQGAQPTGLEQQAPMPPTGQQMPPEAMMAQQGMMPPPPMGMYGGSYAQGGMIGQEMEVTPQQLEDLRKKGIQFEIV